MRFLREPLLHFLLLGTGLFVVFGLTGGRTGDRPDRIVVTPGQIEHLMAGFTRTWQRPPTAQELDGLIEGYIREEVLYREALAMGLDEDDTIVRRRLAQKVEFLMDDAGEIAAPSDEELLTFLQKYPDSFRAEPQLAFQQVYLSRDRRGEAAAGDARQLLAQLTASETATDLAALGDPLMLPHEFELTPLSEIARQFGDAFGRRLLEAEPGRWAGPIESGYGLHLVLVREHAKGRMPELAEVREAVEREWLAARRKQADEAAYGQLRERYTVVVEQPKGSSSKAPGLAEVR